MRKAAIALLLFMAVPVMASAQTLPSLDKFSITLGVGGSVPLRTAEFVDGWQPAFYRVLNLEYAVSPTVSVSGKYDRAIFDPTNPEAGQVDVTSWGGGLLIFFPIRTGSTIRGWAEIGAMKNQVEGSTQEWSAPVGAGIDWAMSAQASLRFGGEIRTLSNSDQIESVTFKGLLNVRPGTSQ